MRRNIYDDEGFFREYSRLPRSIAGLDGAPEWPALRALLPQMRGLRVLDLGCGFGWFCRWARGQGAAAVEGIDASQRMLARARADTTGPGIVYRLADMEAPELPAGVFDLVLSSLALHYVERLEPLIAEVYRSLSTDGRLVFSVEHPIFTAPAAPGWSTDAAGRRTWPLEGYLDEGVRVTDWLAAGVVKRHRTMASWLNLLLRVGFALSHIEEWGPTREQIAAHPEWADERSRPPFLLVAARR